MRESNQNRILELDAMRGIAAICVVIFHYTIGNSFCFVYGKTGVELFFIISGFVISLTLSKTKSWNDFIVNRFSRLFPTYWVVVTFTTIVLVFAGVQIPLKQYLTNLTMMQHYFKVDDIDWPYWTLLVELVFYAVMLLLFVTKTLKYIEFIGIGLLLFVSALNIPFFENNYPSYYRQINFIFPLLYHFPLFFSGIMFYKMYFDKQTFLRYVIIIYCIAVRMYIFKIDPTTPYTYSKIEFFIMLLIWYSLFTIYINKKLNFLVNRFTVFLGSISFSLYLVHERFGLYVLMPFLYGKLGINPILSIVLAIIIIVLMAYGIMRLIEKPSMNFVRSKYKSLKHKSTTV